MKRFLAVALLAMSVSATAQVMGPHEAPVALGQVLNIRTVQVPIEQYLAATSMLYWQSQRIAELEAKCGDVCK